MLTLEMMARGRQRDLFRDKRSKKIVLAVHCLFNQNARIDGCAYFPGAMGEAARVLAQSGVGMLQLPCPELAHLGLDRQRHGGRKIGIREALSLKEGKAACREMAKNVVYQIKEYQRHGFKVIGAIGNDGSPACGVNFTHYRATGPGPGPGAFIKVLGQELDKAGIKLDFIAIRDHAWKENVRRIKKLLRKNA
jgi:predicted secreted protein